jgi:hypothetical protein
MSGHNDQIMQNRTWNLHEELIKTSSCGYGQRYGQHRPKERGEKVRFYRGSEEDARPYLRRSLLRLIER